MTFFYADMPGTAFRRLRVLLAFIFLMLATRAFANEGTQLVPLTLQERVQQSDVVVEGEVVSQRAFWDARHENIYTSNIVDVYKVFKGQLQARQVEVITQGGAVGLHVHQVSSALRLHPGQQGLFFLQQEQQLVQTPGAGQGLTAKVFGGQQGFVKYDLDRHTAADMFHTYPSVQALYQEVTAKTGTRYRTVAENTRLRTAVQQEQRQEQQAPAAPVISSFSPTVSSAGTNTLLTINGSGFGSTRGSGFVEFRNADDGGQTFVKPLASQYVSWSNNQIRLYIPSAGADDGTAGSGEIRVTTSGGLQASSTQTLTLEFTYLNINVNGRAFKPSLADINGEGGYTVHFAPSMQSNNAAEEGFRRALNSWVCTTTVNWQIGEPTSIEKTADDGVSVIRFSSDLEAGVLASTLSRYEGCIVGQDTVWWVSEFDMEINSAINWQYGPGPPVNRQYDFQTVMLHELGHAHQLGHVILPRAVMHYAIEFEVLVRDLAAADVSGANLVLAHSLVANPCGVEPMEPKLDGDCNIAPEIYTFEADFEDGQVITSWTTNKEKSIAYFVVQRSADGLAWDDISGQIDAEGPSTGFLDYAYTDPEPLPRISYYRVRVVYTDGSESFSPRFRVINPNDLQKLAAYPNPVSPEDNTLFLEFIVKGNTPVSMQLYDATGKLVRSFDVTFTDTNLPAELDMAGVASGMYILKWQSKTRSGEVRVLKL